MNFKVHVAENMRSIFWLTGKPYTSKAVQRRRINKISIDILPEGNRRKKKGKS